MESSTGFQLAFEGCSDSFLQVGDQRHPSTTTSTVSFLISASLDVAAITESECQKIAKEACCSVSLASPITIS